MTELVKEICCWKECKVAFGLEAGMQAQLRRNGAWFYCPNGHQQQYTQGKTAEQKLREELEAERLARQRAEQNSAMWQDDAREAREEAEHQRRRANGYKGHATKITKRAKAGICPCCNRHFVQLERHMASKHPEFTPLDLESQAS